MKCLDTYALMEFHYGNPNSKHLQDQDFVIADFTFVEFYTNLLKLHDKKTADYWYRILKSYCQSVPLTVLLEAAVYRRKYKKQNLSLVDCIGYLFARDQNILFVTGDKEFKSKPGVEFISA